MCMCMCMCKRGRCNVNKGEEGKGSKDNLSKKEGEWDTYIQQWGRK